MLNPFYQYHSYDPEKEYWKQLAQSYFTKVNKFEQEVETINSTIKPCEHHIQNQQLSFGITIQNLKVNNIQSGAAFNIAEKLVSSTRSDMDMDMDLGPNSMNVGDGNERMHREECKVKLLPPQEWEDV